MGETCSTYGWEEELLNMSARNWEKALDRLGTDRKITLKLILNDIVAAVEWVYLAKEQGEVAGAAGKLLLSQYGLQPLSWTAQ